MKNTFNLQFFSSRLKHDSFNENLSNFVENPQQVFITFGNLAVKFLKVNETLKN